MHNETVKNNLQRFPCILVGLYFLYIPCSPGKLNRSGVFWQYSDHGLTWNKMLQEDWDNVSHYAYSNGSISSHCATLSRKSLCEEERQNKLRELTSITLKSKEEEDILPDFHDLSGDLIIKICLQGFELKEKCNWKMSLDVANRHWNIHKLPLSAA